MNYNKLKRSVQNLTMPDDMKERIISKCESVSEETDSADTEYEEKYVFTAERVPSHPVRSALSFAAACILCVGGIGGTTYLISKNGVKRAELSSEINSILFKTEITVEKAVFSNNPYVLTDYNYIGTNALISEKKEITEEQKNFINELWNKNVFREISKETSVLKKQAVLSIVSDVSENLSYSLIIYENNIAEFIKTENDETEVISYYEIKTSEFEVNIFPMFDIPPVGDLRNMPVSRSVKGEALTTDKSLDAVEMNSEKKDRLAALFESIEWKLSENQLTSFESDYAWLIEFGSYEDGGFHNYMVVSDENGGYIQVLLSGATYTYDIDFEYVDEKLTEIFDEGKLFSELELYKGIPTIENDEPQGAVDVPEEYMITDNLYDRIGINRQYYIDKLLKSDFISDDETKSYIYHIMLNSVDYFDTAEGECKHGDFNVIFRTDIPNQTSNEKEYYGDELTHEYDYYINKPSLIEELEDGTIYITDFDTPTTVKIVKDSHRVCAGSDGTLTSNRRTDWTNLPTSREFLMPEHIAFSCLTDFSTWDITGIEEKLGRKCAVLEGYGQRGDFRLSIDIETGIMISCEIIGNSRIEYEITSLNLTVRDY